MSVFKFLALYQVSQAWHRLIRCCRRHSLPCSVSVTIGCIRRWTLISSALSCIHRRRQESRNHSVKILDKKQKNGRLPTLLKGITQAFTWWRYWANPRDISASSARVSDEIRPWHVTKTGVKFCLVMRLSEWSTRSGTYAATSQAHSTSYVTQETSGKFGLHAGKMKFNTLNEEWNTTRAHIIVPVYSYIMCNTGVGSGATRWYKPWGRGLDSRWGLWEFSLPQSFRPHNDPGVDSASNRNEYQGSSLGLTTLPPSCADCQKFWKPQTSWAVSAYPGVCRESFAFPSLPHV